MAKTFRTYTSDGVQVVYPIDFVLGYLLKEHVYVYQGNDYTTQLSYTWLNDTQIQLTTPVPFGEILHIRRVVPRDTPINDYENGAWLTEKNLDDSNNQVLHILEEVEDGFITPSESIPILADLDMQNFKINNLKAATTTEGATNLGQVISLVQENSNVLDMLEEEQTAGVNQTTFVLNNFTFVPDRNHISVYKDGDRVSKSSYTEPTNNTVVFNTPLVGGELLIFVVNETESTTLAVNKSPSDGKLYGQRDGKWVEITSLPFFKVGCGEEFMEAGEPEAVAGDFAFLYPQGYSFN